MFTNGNDTVVGSAADEVMAGLQGNDTISGGAGDDLIYGGAGKDRINGGSGDDVLFGGSGKSFVDGGAGDDTIHLTGEIESRISGGMARGGGGDDTYFLTAISGDTPETATLTQIHTYEYTGDDLFHLKFSNIHQYSHGHHVRGDENGSTSRDTYSFEDLDEISDVVAGRLEDFDASRDKIIVEGVLLDFQAADYGVSANADFSVKVVNFDVDKTDSAIGDQSWLLISTSQGGHIFYALEGARVTSDGSGGSGAFETHFMTSAQYATAQADGLDFATMADDGFSDPLNFIPDTEEVTQAIANGATVITDVDLVFSDSTDIVVGTDGEDLIATGINNDTVDAGYGNDIVWGGSGRDDVFGGGGRDKIFGGGDNDFLHGGHNNDSLYGGWGNDYLNGANGSDILDGGYGNDVLEGWRHDDVLFGGAGLDTLDGGRDHDILDGGKHDDILTGGTGNDVFVFKDNYDHDTIVDFSSNEGDKIDLTDVTLLADFTDVLNNLSEDSAGNAIVDGGSATITLIGYDVADLETTFVASDFIF